MHHTAITNSEVEYRLRKGVVFLQYLEILWYVTWSGERQHVNLLIKRNYGSKIFIGGCA